jgi:hypothetical protein
MVKERGMKEKIKRFIENGGIMLIGFWFNIVMMLCMMVKSVLDKSEAECFMSILIFLPWALLFINAYQFMKEEKVSLEKNGKLIAICEKLLGTLERYHALYGELPEEETKEECHGTDQ